MKRILLLLGIVISVSAFAQPAGYTLINSRYDWLAGKFEALHVPGFSGVPTLKTGQFTGAGAIGVDSTNDRFYFYSTSAWRRVLNASDSTLYSSVTRLKDTAAAIRSVIGGGGTPPGSNTQVIFNDAGAFGAHSGIVYNKSTQTMTLTKMIINHILDSGTPDAGLVMSGQFTGSNSIHGFDDRTEFLPSIMEIALASYNSSVTLDSGKLINHYAPFQERCQVNSGAFVRNLYGLFAAPTIIGHVSTYEGLYFHPLISGAGTVANFAAFHAPNVGSIGDTTSYIILIDGQTKATNLIQNNTTFSTSGPGSVKFSFTTPYVINTQSGGFAAVGYNYDPNTGTDKAVLSDVAYQTLFDGTAEKHRVSNGSVSAGGTITWVSALDILNNKDVKAYGNLFNPGITSGVGTKAVRVDPSTGKFTYADTTAASGGGSVTGTGAANQVAVWTGTSAQEGTAGFKFTKGNGAHLDITSTDGTAEFYLHGSVADVILNNESGVFNAWTGGARSLIVRTDGEMEVGSATDKGAYKMQVVGGQYVEGSNIRFNNVSSDCEIAYQGSGGTTFVDYGGAMKIWPSGAGIEYIFDDNNFYPNADGGNVLGKSGKGFGGLFLKSAAVIDFGASNYTLTHSTGALATSGKLGVAMTPDSTFGVTGSEHITGYSRVDSTAQLAKGGGRARVTIGDNADMNNGYLLQVWGSGGGNANTSDFVGAVKVESALTVNSAQLTTLGGNLITGGSIQNFYQAKSATYGITANDDIIDCTSGTFTATLPTAVGVAGKTYRIKNSGSGAITIATTSSQTIDGASTYSLPTQYKYVTVTSNGANWIIIGNN